MGKKKNNNQNHNHEHDHDHKEEGKKEEAVVTQTKEEGGDIKKKKEESKSPMNVVLKIEMHCEGCASKIIKLARGFKGVESVKADSESNKLTITGKVDPVQIRDILHSKTKKKVDLISPQPPKKDDNNNKNKDDTKKSNDTNKKPDNSNAADKNNKKQKEAPVVTAVIKVAFHCLGCIEKIHKIVSKTKGVQEMTLDKQKETVTVKGNMDVKALTEILQERLKRPVEIVPPKKDKDGEKDGENGGGGGEGKKKKGGGGGGGGAGGDNGGEVGAKMEGNRMEYMMQPGFAFGPGPGYGYAGQPVYGNGYMGQPVSVPVPVPVPVPAYGNGYVGMGMGMGQPPPMSVYEYGYGYGQGPAPGYPVHMKFNDENPNACSIM